MLYFKESLESQKTCEVLKKDKKKFAKTSQLTGKDLIKLFFVVKSKTFKCFHSSNNRKSYFKMMFCCKK